MRRIRIIAMFLISTALIMACNGNINMGNTSPSGGDEVITSLYFRSNVDGIEANSSITSRTDGADNEASDVVIGEPIVGVLLDFRPAADYGYGADVCYLHYLGDGILKDNGEGMMFNYILYCPPIIQKTYYEGRGIDAISSGNSFWWYMSTYFNLSIDQIKEDWYSALNILLKQDELPVPKSSDVQGEWQEPLPVLPSISIPEFDPKNEIIVLTEIYSPVTVTMSSYANDPMIFSPYGKLGGYDSVVYNAFYISKDGPKVYFPMAILDAYDNHMYSMWMYMEDYLGLPKEKVDAEGLQLIVNKLLEASEYGTKPLPFPEGAEGLTTLDDYFPEGFSIDLIKDDQLYVIGNYDDVSSLITISNYKESPFYGVEGYEKVVSNCFIIGDRTIYFPKAASEAYEERYGFSGDNTGDPFWSYLRSLGLVQSAVSHTVAEATKLLIEKGTLPYPDISKYR